MEDVIFIIVAFIWLMYSLYQNQSKKKSKEKSQPSQQSPPTEEAQEEGTKDFETVFREIFGEEGAKGKQTKDAEVVQEQQSTEATNVEKERAQPWQYHEQEDSKYQEHTGMLNVGDDYEFSAEGKIERIEDQVEKQKEEDKEDKSLEVIDLWDDENYDKEHFSLDPKQAIIYHEIIKRKY